MKRKPNKRTRLCVYCWDAKVVPEHLLCNKHLRFWNRIRINETTPKRTKKQMRAIFEALAKAKPLDPFFKEHNEMYK